MSMIERTVAVLAFAWAGIGVGQAANLPDPPAPPLPPAPRDGVSTRPPSILLQMPPHYPEDAVCAGVGGTVVTVLSLDEDGRVVEALIEKSSRSRSLDRAALATARGWRFNPGTENDVPVPTRVRVPVDFEPKVQQAPPYCSLPVYLAGVFLLHRPVGEDTPFLLAEDDDAFGATETIHVVAGYTRIAPDAQGPITVTWTRLQDDGPPVLVHRQDTAPILGAGSRKATLAIPPPAEGWKPGRYVLNMRFGEQALDSRVVTIAK